MARAIIDITFGASRLSGIQGKARMGVARMSHSAHQLIRSSEPNAV